jgi:quinoprotein dehydrogenase-associated probable ABC transporter substrate-binding protein
VPRLFRAAAVIAMCMAMGSACRTAEQRVFRVCADPNNLPFSNQQGEGFENHIAELIARDLNARVEYTWFAQRRSFIRNTLSAGVCDVVMGVPAGFERTATTRPYYRSTYVFVSHEDRKLSIGSMDDPALKRLNIGVHLIGDDYANPPPVHALSRRHIVRNVHGYSIYGDYSQPNPPARLIEAVSAGQIDIAIVWGPFAGYFGKRQPAPLRIVPVSPETDSTGLPFAFDIAMGVRRNDKALLDELEHALERRQPEIQRILAEYSVPIKRGFPVRHEQETRR